MHYGTILVPYAAILLYVKGFNLLVVSSLLTICSVRLEQGAVTALLQEKGTVKGVHYKTKTGEELTAHAPLTIVCDGCFSNLRRSLCDPKVKIRFCEVTRKFVWIYHCPIKMTC